MSEQPPPPQGGQPQWQPQWGQQPYYPPPPSPGGGGLSGWAQVALGGLIGLVVGPVVLLVVLVIIGAASADSSGEGITGEMVFALCVLVPTLLPVPMLFFRVTRMWAVGLVIGAGVASISLAGACALIITGLSEGSA